MDTPIYFYHATSLERQAMIMQGGSLMPQVHNPPQEWMWLVNQGRHLVPNGVWFCATLYNGDLPDRSPYGDRRVRIRIDNVIAQLGGIQNVRLYSGVTDQMVGDNRYVRLMLVKQGDINTLGLLANNCMQQVDIAINPWLRLDTSLTGGYKVASTPIWVEIYIPYPIDVRGCPWDQVYRI